MKQNTRILLSKIENKFYGQGQKDMVYPDILNCAQTLLEEHEHSHKTAIYFEGGEWSYHAFVNRINQTANFLSKNSLIKPGSRVLLNGFSSPMVAVCWFAIIKLGGICVATSSALKKRELSSIISQSEVNLAIVDDGRRR